MHPENELLEKIIDQLHHEKKLSDSIINSLPGIFYLFNKEGKFYRWNKNFELVSGYSHEEIKHMHPLDFFKEEEKKLIQEKIQNVFIVGFDNVEAHFLTKDTTQILYFFNGMLTSYEGEDCLLGVGLDLSDRVQSQQQMLIEKELSDSIVNSLPGIFYLFNQAGKFYRWNKNFEKVSGYNPEEIVKMHPLEFFPEEEKEHIMKKLINVFISGEENVEANVLTKSGEKLFYYLNGRAIKFNGEYCVSGIGLDLSEKLKSQEQLVESEEKFRTLIEQASDGIFISNQQGNYSVVNSSAASLTGYSKAELLRMNMAEVFFEQDMEPALFIVQDLSQGHTKINEKLIRQKNGGIINVEISSKMLPGGMFQAIVRDITARKWAEEGLRYSEEKRRLIMIASLDAIICIDTADFITFWNPTAERIFGWTTEEVLGKKLSSIIIPEKYRLMHDRGMEHYARTGEGNVFNKILELTAMHRSGEEFPIELTVLPIKQGNEEFFCAFIRDITSRKKTEEIIRISENKYRQLFEQNPLPMWMISMPDENILAVNEAAVNIYGYSKEEFLLLNINDLLPVEEKNNAPSMISTYQTGISNTGVLQHRKKDGNLIMVNFITHDTLYEEKQAKLILVNDLSEKIIAEEKLKNSHKELRELATHLQNIRESERSHMAREIHDELGQQLTGLKMDISWINKKIEPSDFELKQKMSETIKLIDNTVRTVRRIATQLRPSILDDLGIIAAMEWQSEEFQKRSEIETIFKTTVSNLNISSQIAIGLFRIYQENLTNVLRHSQATKVNTQLSMQGNLLILNINDNGIGFNPADIKNKKTLGLLGMKERTLILGGTYEISSIPGKGTSVVITIPII